ncbi:MAG: hypothetical protein LBI02_06175 [Opitutaceae bacterium]|jgi:hypothetical protein|nr:hypothetical protein [Opitutaceae bacterium]
MTRTSKTQLRGLLPALALLLPLHAASAAADPLADGFASPPEPARPRTWWHWTRSNITKEGITKDLEWMKRAGLGGFMLADVNSGAGQTVEPQIKFGTPEWYDAVRHAAAEADRLGLEMGIFSSPGWSETGGPWVQPEQAMKKLVWSELVVDVPADGADGTGGAGVKKISVRLPRPPSENGQIRNTRAGYYSGPSKDPTFYADSAVVAFRIPDAEQAAAGAPPPRPRVTTHHGPVDGAALLDDDLNSTLAIDAPQDGGPAWVQYEFSEKFAARAITLGGRGGSANGIPVGRVLAGDDGVHFRTLVTLPGTQLYRQGMVRTYVFEPVAAKFFRVEMTGAPIGPAATMSQQPSPPAQRYVLSEAVLHGGARVHRWEEKAGFSFLFEYDTVATPPVSASDAVARREVIDLTTKMKPDGTLDCDLPPGKWSILRLGYSLTGAKNRPATPEGSGFEADKLSRRHMEAYYHGYFDPLKKALGPLYGKSLRYVMMDSWEAGTNNWSDDLLKEFRARRGYEPAPFLPALTGRVVESAEASDRFLWDFRRTLADLWAENHYGTMADLLRRDGIGIYAEAAGVSLEMPEDTLLNKSKVEIPAGEFWVRDLHPRLMYLQDVRGAASASHVYGKRLVAAESFTGGGYESPYTLKKVGDYWLAQGINRIVFHTSAHQPLDTLPGNTMVGTHLHRNITWAGLAAPYMAYVARSSHLLQQGLFVADIAYLLDEGAPSTPPIWADGTRPTPPEGYDYDFINADVLLNRMSVAGDGRLVLPDGMSYRVLVLPETDRMRPELLRKIDALARGGAIVVGRKPLRSPSLAGFPACDDEVRALAAGLWGDLDGASRTIRRVGQGTVIWGWPMDRVMAMQKIAKDFEHGGDLDTELAWLHRRDHATGTDIYYVANLTDAPRDLRARFRVSGREAEIWRADDGSITAASFEQNADGLRTTVPLRLATREAVFVVFRKPSAEKNRVVPAPPEHVQLATLDGAWDVSFPSGLGAPARVPFEKLVPWGMHADAGVKYFSGTATYTHAFQAERAWLADGARVLLDLGGVGDIAEVAVNGRPLGILWKPPYRIDITGALHDGGNHLEIKVTNQWTNRLIGDMALPDGEKILSSPVRPGPRGVAAPALPESGLLGPATLWRAPAYPK